MGPNIQFWGRDLNAKSFIAAMRVRTGDLPVATEPAPSFCYHRGHGPLSLSLSLSLSLLLLLLMWLLLLLTRSGLVAHTTQASNNEITLLFSSPEPKAHR